MMMMIMIWTVASFLVPLNHDLYFFYTSFLSSLVQLSTAIRWIVLPGEKKDVITVSLSTNLEPGELYCVSMYLSIYQCTHHLCMYLSIYPSINVLIIYVCIYLITRRPSRISSYQD